MWDWDKAGRITELERKVKELQNALNEVTQLVADRFEVESIMPPPGFLHGSGPTLRRLQKENNVVYVRKLAVSE